MRLCGGKGAAGASVKARWRKVVNAAAGVRERGAVGGVRMRAKIVANEDEGKRARLAEE
jgi:hypothetical protein